MTDPTPTAIVGDTGGQKWLDGWLMMIESFWDVIIYTLENEQMSPKKEAISKGI